MLSRSCLRSAPTQTRLCGRHPSEPPGPGPAALTCSVSTKLDTCPSSFTPRVWKRAPARAQLMREMRQALVCLWEAYTVRMATTPQMTFSSQSQQLTWCCLRGRCNSWFLQNGPHRDSGHLTSSRKRGRPKQAGRRHLWGQHSLSVWGECAQLP